jgi:hypothetical protein
MLAKYENNIYLEFTTTYVEKINIFNVVGYVVEVHILLYSFASIVLFLNSLIFILSINI